MVREVWNETTAGGARGVAFSVLGYTASIPNKTLMESERCSGLPTDYISFVIINEVKPEDNLTQLTFNITSIPGDKTIGQYQVKACKCMCVCGGGEV